MMELTSHTPAVFRILLVAFILGMMLLVGTAVSHGAVLSNSDETPFFVDEMGLVQQPDYWLPYVRSRSRADFEIARRLYNEQLSQDVLNRSQETIQNYYSSKAMVPPAGSSFWVTPDPRAQTRLCTEVGTRMICH